MNTKLWRNKCSNSENNLDVNRRAKINAKLMLKFVSSTSAVGAKSLLAIGNNAHRQDKS